MRLITFLVILCTLSCKQKPADISKKEPTGTNGFDWIVGDWARTNDEDGKQTFEYWTKSSDSLYLGLGFTMVAADTVWRETVQLVKSNDIWSFNVIGLGESISTDFAVTAHSEKTFTCENEANEFPKKIRYFIQNDSLMAIISGGGPEIPFTFGRK